MDEASKKLVDEINKLYASGKMGVGDSEPKSTSPSGVHLSSDAPPIGNLSQALIDDIDVLLNKLRDNDLPFMLSIVVSTEETEQEHKMVISNYSWMPVRICEFLAAQTVLTMPHAFSHAVLELARQVNSVKGFLDEFFKAMGDDDEEE